MIRPAKSEHAKLMADDLLQDIKEEVWASGGYTPLEACEVALKNSAYSWAGYLYDELACLFGIMEVSSPTAGNFAIPWALTGHAVHKYPFTYWRGCKDVVKIIQPEFPLLINMVDARRQYALHWIRRLGFKVYDPEPWGKFQMPFCKIEMRSGN